jgi:hypothetical protein
MDVLGIHQRKRKAGPDGIPHPKRITQPRYVYDETCERNIVGDDVFKGKIQKFIRKLIDISAWDITNECCQNGPGWAWIRISLLMSINIKDITQFLIETNLGVENMLITQRKQVLGKPDCLDLDLKVNSESCEEEGLSSCSSRRFEDDIDHDGFFMDIRKDHKKLLSEIMSLIHPVVALYATCLKYRIATSPDVCSISYVHYKLEVTGTTSVDALKLESIRQKYVTNIDSICVHMNSESVFQVDISIKFARPSTRSWFSSLFSKNARVLK